MNPNDELKAALKEALNLLWEVEAESLPRKLSDRIDAVIERGCAVLERLQL